MIRKISPSLNFSKNIKYNVRPYNKLYCVQSTAMTMWRTNNYVGLSKYNVFNFSTNSDVEVEKAKLIVPSKGYLSIRNS